jgi:sugar-specific transcriptional regulator TrmB
MKTETAFIDELIGLGVQIRQAKLYVALLRIPEATPAMLQTISAVPRTKVYEALEHLCADGLCSVRREGRLKFYRATAPQEAYALLRKRWDDEHARRCQTAEAMFTEFTRFHTQSQERDPTIQNIEVIRSKRHIFLKSINLTDSCQIEMLSFTRSPYAAADDNTRAALTKAQQEAFKRGTKSRTIYMTEERERGWLQGFIKELEKSGEEVRLIADLPMKMLIFDRRSVMVALPSVPGITGSDFSCLVVEDPCFTAGCRDLFETYWERAKPLAEYS